MAKQNSISKNINNVIKTFPVDHLNPTIHTIAPRAVKKTSSPIKDEPITPEMMKAIKECVKELSLSDHTSVIRFGSKAQAGLKEISRVMLSDVQNKGSDAADASLTEMVTTIRDFSSVEVDGRREPTIWEKITRRKPPAVNFMASYEHAQRQVNRLTEDLLKHEYGLLRDIKSLDILYARTIQFYDNLSIYIIAGEKVIEKMDRKHIPEMQAKLDAAGGDRKRFVHEEMRDLQSFRDDMERRVHDLRLTRQVTMQSIPSIRMIQENDKMLVSKVSSTLVNTIPLWEMQLAQAITIRRGAAAAKTLRQSSDATNGLLTANAANLRQANAQIRKQNEEGVFDVAAIKKANEEIISAIEESLQIAREGRAKRKGANEELDRMEQGFTSALSTSKIKMDPPTAIRADRIRVGAYKKDVDKTYELSLDEKKNITFKSITEEKSKVQEELEEDEELYYDDIEPHFW